MNKEHEIICRLAQYIADMESLEYSEEEMIAEVDDFVKKEQEQIKEIEEMDVELPDCW